jgi:uncharacterized protein YjbI with pentapeptide repeats
MTPFHCSRSGVDQDNDFMSENPPKALPRPDKIKPLTLWLAILAAVVVSLGIMGGAYLVVVQFFDTPGRPDEVRARATALVTGALASIAITLAILKERLSIRAHNHVQEVEQRRVGELAERLHRDHLADLRLQYVTAAGQLGNDSSAVRIAGANALAALALEWNDLAQRQACVDVLCAYLRMPPARQQLSKQTLVVSRRAVLPKSRTSVVDPNDRQVRLTIQRLLRTHLTPSPGRHWGHVDIDLSGAELEDFNMAGTEFLGSATFTEAIFSGHTSFVEARLSGITTFYRAVFSGHTEFNQANFTSEIVNFNEATFSYNVTFYRASFTQGAIFYSTVFAGRNAWFSDVVFDGPRVDFHDSRFSCERTAFDGASFLAERVSFHGSVFSGATVSFDQAHFMLGPVPQDEFSFKGSVTFGRATFMNGPPTMAASRFSYHRQAFSGYPSPATFDSP